MGWLTALREDAYPTAPMPALPDSPDFAWETARAAAWAAQLAYETLEDGKLERILDAWRWPLRRRLAARFVDGLPLGGTKGFVAETGGQGVVIAFAGTEPDRVRDWITDLRFLPDDQGVHRGFARAARAIWDRVAPEAASAGGPVLLAGHSLGGAIAALVAMRLLDERVLPPERLRGVYTIGMPRAGGAAFAARYGAVADGALAARTFRFVHGADIVPQVPPAVAPFGYRHVGRVAACGHGGVFAAPPEPAPDRAPRGRLRVLAGLAAALVGPTDGEEGLPAFPAAHRGVARSVAKLPRAIRDHLPDRYIHALGG